MRPSECVCAGPGPVPRAARMTEPPLSARPRPAARRRKRLVGGALCSSLAVIPEPCDSPEPSPAPSPSPAPTTAPAPTLANGPTSSSNAPTGGLGALQEEEEEEEEEGKEKEDEGRSLPDANERGSSLKSVLSGRTFFTCTSGDYSDLRWFDADEADTDEEESLYDFFECGGDDAHAPHSRLVSDVYSAVIQRKIETLERAASGGGASGAGDGMSRRAGAGATAAEDAVVPASPTHSAKRREKAASGFFSFFRWFRKGRGDGDEEEDAQGDADADGDVEDEGAPGGSLPPTPASLRVVRAHSASCGSIDTLFSTAT
ncbi:RanBP-type and C3HC4-type zinc finger-containing protein 1, partial [Gryllus bimaculatus]